MGPTELVLLILASPAQASHLPWYMRLYIANGRDEDDIRIIIYMQAADMLPSLAFDQGRQSAQFLSIIVNTCIAVIVYFICAA